MLDLYTDRAHRAVYFARFEAKQHKAGQVEPEHLLFSMIRDDETLFVSLLNRGNGWFKLYEDVGELVKNLPRRTPEISDIHEAQLSDRMMDVVRRTAEIAREMLSDSIGVEHQLIAILEMPKSQGAAILDVLNSRGITAKAVRKRFEKKPVLAKGLW